MNIADRIAGWLHEKEISTIFGIVGAGNIAIFNAIARLGKTQIVCTHHEQAAVMSACGYYRVSGRLSVALVTTGAGSTNAITGVVAAWMDSTPVIVISGNEASKYIGAETRVWGVQGYDSSGLIAKNCKYAERYDDTFPISNYLDAAHQTALKPRQGPVWIDIPKDIQNAAV